MSSALKIVEEEFQKYLDSRGEHDYTDYHGLENLKDEIRQRILRERVEIDELWNSCTDPSTCPICNGDMLHGRVDIIFPGGRREDR